MHWTGCFEESGIRVYTDLCFTNKSSYINSHSESAMCCTVSGDVEKEILAIKQSSNTKLLWEVYWENDTHFTAEKDGHMRDYFIYYNGAQMYRLRKEGTSLNRDIIGDNHLGRWLHELWGKWGWNIYPAGQTANSQPRPRRLRFATMRGTFIFRGTEIACLVKHDMRSCPVRDLMIGDQISFPGVHVLRDAVSKEDKPVIWPLNIVGIE